LRAASFLTLFSFSLTSGNPCPAKVLAPTFPLEPPHFFCFSLQFLCCFGSAPQEHDSSSNHCFAFIEISVDERVAELAAVSRLTKFAVLLFLSFGPSAPLLHAQSGDPSLGDLARSYRKTQAPPRKIIDNDNLSEVMEAGVSKKWDIAGVHFSVDKNAIDMVNASLPDVTCALAYNGQADGPKPENLPSEELTKIEGPATIVGDTFQVAVQNGTAWELREITVGLTLIRSGSPGNTQPGNAKLVPATLTSPAPPERRSDLTLLYYLKGKADGMGAGLFQDQLKLPIPPDQEWHWAVVQAKGIRPASLNGTPSQASPGGATDSSTPVPASGPVSSPESTPAPSPASVSPIGKSLN
jgi:hypothetical protein